MKPALPLADRLAALINSVSRENASNTPDFILAQYLEACLIAFEHATHRREAWYGREPSQWASPATETNS